MTISAYLEVNAADLLDINRYSLLRIFPSYYYYFHHHNNNNNKNRRRNGDSSTKGSDYKLKEKIERTYYQLTQLAIDNRPRLQKLQNMSKIKVILKTANEAMEEILDERLKHH